MAKVSVIMPAYNVAPYISAAIASVAAQTYTDWELLVVDDGSTDETAQIVRAYAGRDSRIRLLAQPNRGCAAARNVALRASAGEYLAILDSDDLWHPSFLATQLAHLEEANVDIVTGNAWMLGGPEHGRPARAWPDRRPQPSLASILADEAAIFIMAVMRRRVYDAIGGFDEALRTGEDYEFWVRAAAAGFRFRRNDRPLGHYRRRDDSLSADDVRMLSGALTVYRKLRVMLEGDPEAARIVDAQIQRLEGERWAAEIRLAVRSGRTRTAMRQTTVADAARTLVRATVGAALARWAPRLLREAQRLRRSRPEAAS